MADTTTCEMGQVCIKRYVNSISNPMDSGYVNALNANPGLTKGAELFNCYYITQKDETLALTNVKDDITTVTSVYTEMANKE